MAPIPSPIRAGVFAAAFAAIIPSAGAAVLTTYNFTSATLAPTSPNPNVVVSNVTLPGDFDVSSSTHMVFFRSNASAPTLAGAIAGGADSTPDYLEVSIRAASGYLLSLDSLTFDHYISNDSSPFTSNFAVFASLDNFTTAPTAGTELGTSTATATTNSGSSAILFNDNASFALASPAYQNLTSATTVTFRIYGYDNLDINGTINRIDELIINGTIVAVPEPSAAALSALGLIALASRRKRQPLSARR